MSDSHLRELERLFRASGSVEDEAAWLIERVRVGELEARWLELAAFLDHTAARRALGVKPPALPGKLNDLLADLQAGWGERAVVRAVVACALDALPDLPEWPVEMMTTLQRAIERLSTWCRCPCAAHGAVAAESIGWMSELFVGQSPEPVWARSLGLAVLRACSVAQGYRDLAYLCGEHLEAVADTLAGGRLHAAISTALTRWSLGGVDPLGRSEERVGSHLTGTLEEQHATLAERLRQGSVNRPNLILAAKLGDGASALVLGESAPEQLLHFDEDNEAPFDQVREALRVIAEHGSETAVRVAITMMSGSEDTPPEWGSYADALLAASREWALCPCQRHSDNAEAAARALRHSAAQLPPQPQERETGPSGQGPEVSALAAAASEEEREAAFEAMAQRAALIAENLCNRWADSEPSRRRWEAERLAILGELPSRPERLADLLPDPPSWLMENERVWEGEWRRWTASTLLWLLGYSDPIRERVEARQREAAGE